MKPRPLVVCALLVCASSAAYPDVQGKRYGITGQDPFRFEVEPALLREWGGYRS